MDRANVLVSLYDFYRGAIGCSLVLGGLTFLIEPGRSRVYRRLGLLFAAVGFLYCLVSLDVEDRVPEALSSFLILAAILAASQAFFDITGYLFGDDHRGRRERLILLLGIAWFLLLWSLRFLDQLFGWGAARGGTEGGARLGPLHTAASIAVYAWPLAISAVAVRTGHRSLRDFPAQAPGTRLLVRSALLLALALCVTVAGAALSSVALYRGGDVAIETLTLGSYLLVVARPDLFSLARQEIHEAREKALRLDDEEARLIIERIARVAADPSVLGRPDLNLRALAAIVKVPPYRLSICFNTRLKTSFPVWLNAQRIEGARRKLLEQPERGILDISIEAGYASRAVFNKQFLRSVGMSPSEYRRKELRQEGPGAVNR
ncbi:MAG: helix-turn-helix domain-containing protein [Treponema sp.]|nr:helix-turn-helix domain-containing protein [Treponema sp.]